MISEVPGSFRDPSSHVVSSGDSVLRLLDDRGLAAWRRLRETALFKTAVADGRLIAADELNDPPPGSAGAIRHPVLPLITYPYEWTFSMLKDAALLQLDLLDEALKQGLTIKDATPFNIQFVAGAPVFIDIGSFEPYRPGEPWVGYRQFTRQFLFPLMLRAWVGIPFQPWLRGDMEGPTPGQMRNLLSFRRRITPAGLLHVVLPARLEARMAGVGVRQDLAKAGFTAEMILTNVSKLRRLVESLDWSPSGEGWSDYHSCAHVGRDRDVKAGFLKTALDRTGAKRVLDLGANDGHFSVIAAKAGALAMAIDGDEAVLDRLYQQARDLSLSVVVTDLGNPSPSQGWAGAERPALVERARPDLVIAYGLIHHLIYTSSIPPRRVLEWLRSFDCPVLVEFVSPQDEMVVKLTVNKLPEELHEGGDETAFRRVAGEMFDLVGERRLGSSTRLLFELNPR